ncbi:MAG: tRNA pseudouridine(55) synthase TruB [Clostridia bacterium]|nr:tRNA pseudouridine(55) synthase TruB [Clostridia bacterium]
MTGVVCINKPIGKSSHFAVAVIRRITKIKKVGHTGTLDPLATGVLPVCIGREATKLSQLIMDSDKEYRAVLKLGISTTTQDSEGEILSQKEVNVTNEQIEKAVESFVGEISQIPPMYSAIKIDGKKLYELARKGVEVERKPRIVTINYINILNISGDEVEMVIGCTKGTYIRTLCNDIGDALGCGGFMKSLVRTKCGGFSIENSITLEEFEELYNKGEAESVIVSPEDIMKKKTEEK